MNIKKIFSKKFAIYLRSKGFKIIGTEVNFNQPQFDVYIFEDIPALRAAMDEYMQKR